MDIVDTCDRVAIESNDGIAFFDRGEPGGARGIDGRYAYTAFLRQIVEAHDAARKRDILSANSKPAPPHPSMLENLADDDLGGIDRGGEANALRGHDDGGIHANDLPACVGQRTAGIARVECG